MNTLTTLFTIASFIVLVGGLIGGYMVIKTTMAQAEIGVQTRVREALMAENAVLSARLKRIEQDCGHMRRLVDALVEFMKKQGTEIILQEDTVIIRRGGNRDTIHISPDEE